MSTVTVPEVVARKQVVFNRPVHVKTLYRRAGEEPKPAEFYVLAVAIVRGQARLLSTNDATDVSDGRLALRYADSCSKLDANTTVEDWDISKEEVDALLSGLYFFPYSPAFNQVQHLDENDPNVLAEAIHGYDACPFSEIQAESVEISLIQTQ